MHTEPGKENGNKSLPMTHLSQNGELINTMLCEKNRPDQKNI